MNLGSGIAESYSWNDRLQQTGVSAGSLLSLSFAPCVGGGTVCANNNGSIQQQTITLPGASATQVYSYDRLNRLIQASENNTSCTKPGSAWCQHFAYDTAGNRRMDQSQGYGSSLWEVNGFSAANNRIANANWRYDDSGNITQNACAETITYDGENRQVSFNRPTATCGAPAGVTSYVYDGLGQRVARTDVWGKQTVFVYDAFGNLAAEYNPAGAPVDRTQYVTVDHLGSTRLVTEASGVVKERHDYHPFGLEAIGGWRTTGLGYGTSTMRQQFTGAEYDSESSMNFLQARYLSTPQGRFTSVDPENAGAALEDPQSWNGYACVSNNPLNYTDPTGEGIFGVIGGILGDMFGGKWHALAGFAAGNAVDVAIWGPGAAGIPGIGYGSSNLTSCGGPLGKCGTLGSGPWSEQTGLGTVDDPGRFVFSATINKTDDTLFSVWTLGTDEVVVIPGLEFSVDTWLRREFRRNPPEILYGEVPIGPGVIRGYQLGRHVLERLAVGARESHVTRRMIEATLRLGRRFWDPKHKSVVHVLERGMASGETIAVATNPATRIVTTVMTGTAKKVIRPRFVPRP